MDFKAHGTILNDQFDLTFEILKEVESELFQSMMLAYNKKKSGEYFPGGIVKNKTKTLRLWLEVRRDIGEKLLWSNFHLRFQ